MNSNLFINFMNGGYYCECKIYWFELLRVLNVLDYIL